MKKNEKPLIPMLDYLRIHRVIRTVLDSIDAHSAHACLFFSIAGAAILREFYKKEAHPVAGAMCLLVDEHNRNVLTFAHLSDGEIESSSAAFHALVFCEGYLIDFMAPLFPETCALSGHPFLAPAQMFQKKIGEMAADYDHLDQSGDFYFQPDSELSEQLFRSFFQKPAGADLVRVCMQWFRRPPKAMPETLSMTNDLGEITQMKLKKCLVTGAW